MATTVLGLAAGAAVMRVHDVRANLEALRVAQAILDAGDAPAAGTAGRDETAPAPARGTKATVSEPRRSLEISLSASRRLSLRRDRRGAARGADTARSTCGSRRSSCRTTRDDDLAGTVDYGLVAAVAVATAAERPYRLLERLATEIADRLWAAHELAELHVLVRKQAPPVGAPAATAGAEVTYRR